MRGIEDRQGKETRSDQRGNAFACQNLVEALEPGTRNAWHFILKSFLPCQPDIPGPRISSPLFSNVPTNIYRTDSTFLYLPIAAMYLTEQKWRLTRTIDQIDSNEAIRQSFRDLAYYFPLRWPALVTILESLGLFEYFAFISPPPPCLLPFPWLTFNLSWMHIFQSSISIKFSWKRSFYQFILFCYLFYPLKGFKWIFDLAQILIVLHVFASTRNFSLKA